MCAAEFAATCREQAVNRPYGYKKKRRSKNEARNRRASLNGGRTNPASALGSRTYLKEPPDPTA